MASLLTDFKFALRTLAKSPGFTATAIVTLALGIGVNSAIFALTYGVILRPIIPLRPAEVVNLFTARQAANKDYRQFSHAEFLALREATDTFAGVAAANPILTGIGGADAVRRSFAFLVSENYFTLLGTTPAVGRFFTAEEAKPNANLPVVVASHGLWQRLGGHADFVGSTLRINGQPHTVIGVTRADFSGLNALLAPDVWLPLGLFARAAQSFSESHDFVDLTSPRNFNLNLTARLAPGVTTASLPSRLPTLARRLDAVQPPDANGARDLQFEAPSRFSISTSPSGDSTPFPLAGALLGMAGCVLLIACLNLANMLLARGTARAREFALRLALGATRGRIVRQLLVEGLVLAGIGGALGLLVSLWSNDLLLRSLETLFSTMNFSLAITAEPNAVVLGSTLAFALVATILFSLGPALRASRADLVQDLKRQTSEPAAGSQLNRFFAPRQVLVMAQIALSLMLLFGAALFVRGALVAGNAALGFEPRQQLVAELDFSLSNTPSPAARRTMFAALDRVRALPGVTAAALGTQLPYGNVTNMPRFADARTPALRTPAPAEAVPDGADALLTAVTPGYFDTLGVRLLRGRDFAPGECRDEKSPRVAIIDETLAKKLFPAEDALGRQLRYTVPPSDGSPAEMEIVGICAAHRHDALHREPRPRVLVPLAQAYQAAGFLHVRFAPTGSVTSTAMIPSLRTALRDVDPAMPILGILPMETLLDRNIQLWMVRLGAALFGGFGSIALLLAAVGVYGVKAYAVSRRTREIGIRMALGAHPRDVFTLIMRQGALQTGLAVAAGMLLALGAGQLLGSLLYEVSPRDPAALAAAAVLLTTTALIACWLPARRATRVSPLTALREE